jgi:riboflavin kinase/FMN adenylyltransferase
MAPAHDGSTTDTDAGALPLVEALARVDLAARSYVTVGVFDGVHRGHQQLVTAMVEAAHTAHSAAVALTFDPHPATTLGYEPPLLLTTVEERVELLSALGLDALVVLPFTPTTAHTSAADFVASLVHHLHLAELWGGPDFAFGHQREGNISFLRKLGAERGFTIHVVEPLVWEGAPVNSSRVRAALKEGDTAQATGCLGRPYRLTGIVVPGEAERHTRPTTIGLSLSPERLIPADGVYACLAHTEHLGTHTAVVNLRSASAGQTLVAEVHLPDLNLDGQTLALDFVARLPDELQDEQPFPTSRQIAGCKLQIGETN